jgi:hypothetical protein
MTIQIAQKPQNIEFLWVMWALLFVKKESPQTLLEGLYKTQISILTPSGMAC